MVTDLYNNPDGNTDGVFVTVDPSMLSCGFAIARPTNAMEDFICASGTYAAPEALSDAARVGRVAYHLKLICHAWPVKFLVCETPSSLYVKKGRSLTALKVLLAIGGVYGTGGCLNLPVHGFTVRDWKGGGSQYKEHSWALANALWPKCAIAPASEDEIEARLLAMSVVQPTELRMAFGLLKVNAPVDRVLGAFHREWSWGPRELERVEALGAKNRLASHHKRPPGGLSA